MPQIIDVPNKPNQQTFTPNNKMKNQITIMTSTLPSALVFTINHFTVRIVIQGQRYGLNNKLVHKEADPLVEFYDNAYAGVNGFGEFGQFCSRYYLSTLLERFGERRGLGMVGHIPEWSIDADEFQSVQETLAQWQSI
jgi:hypothetical protein